MSTDTEAAIESLRSVPENGKAEVVDGRLIIMAPTGGLPSYPGAEVFARFERPVSAACERQFAALLQRVDGQHPGPRERQEPGHEQADHALSEDERGLAEA